MAFLLLPVFLTDGRRLLWLILILRRCYLLQNTFLWFFQQTDFSVFSQNTTFSPQIFFEQIIQRPTLSDGNSWNCSTFSHFFIKQGRKNSININWDVITTGPQIKFFRYIVPSFPSRCISMKTFQKCIFCCQASDMKAPLLLTTTQLCHTFGKRELWFSFTFDSIIVRCWLQAILSFTFVENFVCRLGWNVIGLEVSGKKALWSEFNWTCDRHPVEVLRFFFHPLITSFYDDTSRLAKPPKLLLPD